MQSGKPLANPKLAAEIQQVRPSLSLLPEPFARLALDTSARATATGAAALGRRDSSWCFWLYYSVLGGVGCLCAEGRHMAEGGPQS
eukprot:SAG31_NODE_4355_length_3319_cov_1.559938_6_plen_86_part_00